MTSRKKTRKLRPWSSDNSPYLPDRRLDRARKTASLMSRPASPRFLSCNSATRSATCPSWSTPTWISEDYQPVLNTPWYPEESQKEGDMTHPPMIIPYLCSPAQSFALSSLFIFPRLSSSLPSITSRPRRSTPVHLDFSYSSAAKSAAIDSDGKTMNNEP